MAWPPWTARLPHVTRSEPDHRTCCDRPGCQRADGLTVLIPAKSLGVPLPASRGLAMGEYKSYDLKLL